MPDRTDRRVYWMPAASVGAGGGYIASDSRLADALMTRLATRRGSPYRIHGSAFIAPGLHNGSGEPMMTARLANLYRKHGIGMTMGPLNLSPRYGHPFFEGGLPEYGTPIFGSGDDVVRQVMSSPAWNKRVVPYKNGETVTEKEVAGLGDIINRNPRIKRKFIRDLRAGKYNGMDVGTIRDMAKLDSSLLLHPELITRSSLSSNPKIEINAFRGFNPANNWSPRPGLSHAENLFDTVTPEGRVNLGSLMGFEANFTENSKSLIPATKIPKSWSNAHGFGAKYKHARDRRKLLDLVASADGKAAVSGLKGKKLVFVTAGSVGPNNSQRLKDIMDAAGRHNDVHVIFQTGANTFAPDLDRVIYDLKRRHPGKMTTVERVDGSMLNTLINGADAYIPYGGSSTAVEAGGHYVPMAFSTDDVLNQGNIDAVRRFRGGSIGMFDNTTTAYHTALKDFQREHGRFPNDSEIEAMANTLTWGRRAKPSNMSGQELLRDLIAHPEKVDDTVAGNRAVFDKLIQDINSGSRYSKSTRSSVRDYLRNAENSNRNAVETARSAILGMLDRSDRALMNGNRVATRSLFARSGSRRVKALKYLLSGKGMKGLMLRLGNKVSNTPTGRRIAIPAMALGALTVGGTAYGLSRPKSEFGIRESFGKLIKDVFKNKGGGDR